MIDLTRYDDWPENASLKIDPWDILGVLACLPTSEDLGNGQFRWKVTVFQTENEYVNIEFNTSSADEEPKFQRLENPPGSIVYIRHIKPHLKSEAGLYSPFGRSEAGKKHYNHRTFFAIDASTNDLRRFEQVSPAHFTGLLHW